MNEAKLLKIVEASLLESHLPKIQIRSGREEPYQLGSHTVFETSIVERLVRRAAEQNEDCVGWEVTYPYSSLESSSNNSAQNNWRRSMLDFGLGYVDRSLEERGFHLFRFAVEVKRWGGPLVQPVPFSIWQDIWKLAGYWIPQSTPVINRYMLVVFEQGICTEKEIAETFSVSTIERFGARPFLDGWNHESIEWAARQFAKRDTLVSVLKVWTDTDLGAVLLLVNCQ